MRVPSAQGRMTVKQRRSNTVKYRLTCDFGEEKANTIIDVGDRDYVWVKTTAGRHGINPREFPQIFERVPGEVIEIRFKKIGEAHVGDDVKEGSYCRYKGSSDAPFPEAGLYGRSCSVVVEVFEREDIYGDEGVRR